MDENVTENVLIDRSGDRNYFCLIPNLIDELGLSVFAVRLYCHIKRITGESGNGVCWQSTRTLAEKCNMSIGSVSNAKSELEKENLITVLNAWSSGKHYHQIAIVDIWARNLEYFTTHRSPGERTEATDGTENTPPPVGVSPMDEQQTSVETYDLVELDCSPGEQDRSPHEQHRSPGETKKNPIKNNPIKKTEGEVEKQTSPLVKKGDMMDGMLHYARLHEGKLDCTDFPEDIRPLVQKMCDLWGLMPPRAKTSEFTFWVKGARSLADACGEFGVDAIEQAYFSNLRSPYTVSSPQSLINPCRAEAGKLRRSKPKTLEPDQPQYSKETMAEIKRAIDHQNNLGTLNSQA